MRPWVRFATGAMVETSDFRISMLQTRICVGFDWVRFARSIGRSHISPRRARAAMRHWVRSALFDAARRDGAFRGRSGHPRIYSVVKERALHTPNGLHECDHETAIRRENLKSEI
jgi:hypothetical protein